MCGQVVGQRLDGAIAVAGPGHIVQGRAEEAVEQGIAGGCVVGGRWFDAPVIDGEVAGEPEARGGGCNLPLAVGLHDAARDERVGAGRHRFVQHVVELPELVAAEADAGAVFALHPNARPFHVRGQPPHGLERRGQVGEAEPGKRIEFLRELERFRAIHHTSACRSESMLSAWPEMVRPRGEASSSIMSAS